MIGGGLFNLTKKEVEFSTKTCIENAAAVVAWRWRGGGAVWCGGGGGGSSQDRGLSPFPARSWPDAFHATFIHNIQRIGEDRIGRMQYF